MKILRLLVPLAFTALTGCASLDLEGPFGAVSINQPRYGYSQPQPESYPRPRQSNSSYFHENGYTELDIPRGHYPPPGECRIWYPDRPAGHQPPPVRCGSPVPAGAWLIQHPHNLPREHVQVTVFEPRRPGVIRAVGEFNIGSGTLVRVVLDK